MFPVNLLGGAVLHVSGGPVTGRAAHRRRLALLAILSIARGRTVGRERIIGLLWPDHRIDAARHLLSESLYVLRKELGEDAFVSAGDEVGLNPAVVLSDVAEFERAMEEGRLEDGTRLYRGPFMDGFFVSGAAEFERWAQTERDRLARAFTRALECLAEEADAAGRAQDAAGWWRRLAVHDPYNSRVGMRLMLALDAAGERAAALWFAESHTTLLREELGVEPEPEFAGLVERLRTEPVRLPPHPPASPPPPGPGAEEQRGPSAAAAPRLDEPQADEPAGNEPGPLVAGEPDPDPDPVPGPDPATTPVLDPDLNPRDPGLHLVAGLHPVPAAPVSSHRGPRWRLRSTHLAGTAGLMIGVLVAGLSAYRTPRPEPAAAPGYDPRRIAVLYLDDHSPGGQLAYLANGLTEMLIHDLSQVGTLDVISRNGVKPYRDRPVPFDSLAADLRAGSVVEGSVQQSGDSVRVTVQLIDGGTGSHVESRTIVKPMAGVFALEDALAEEVSGFLRRRVGREIRLRQARAETRSAEAWRLVQQAEQASDDAARLRRSRDPLDVASADRLLRHADSLLVRAERADPDWTRPTVQRGWIAHRMGWGTAEPRAAHFRAAALGHAERALRREPGSTPALELRGAVRFDAVMSLPDTAGQAARLEQAEQDLRAAVAAEPARASAWSMLSQVLRYRGRFAESDLAARRALAEDAYLDGATDVLHRLYFSALFTGDYREAGRICDEGRRRAPTDWRFVECRLTLMREDRSRPADPAAAATLVAELERLDPEPGARAQGRGYSPLYRQAVLAAILAQAEQGDSAQAVLARARRAAANDDDLTLSLDYDEAYARLLLGERRTAGELLHRALSRRPALRPFATRDPLLRELLTRPPAAAGTPRASGASPFP
jgi:DNA-binding SARP family transcriptional activator/TolB-like protein